MALKDRFRKAIGREGRSSSTSTSSGPGTGTTTPNQTLTTTSTNTTVDPKDPTHITNNLSKQTTNAPGITLTKTLTKTLTWTSHKSKDSRDHTKPSKQELKEKKAVEAWKKQDAEEWSAPKSSRPGRKNQKCQDTLRAFDFTQGGEKGGVEERSRSICSGISPSQSRANSVDVGSGEGLTRVLSGGRKRSSVGAGKLSQEIGREDVQVGDKDGEINGHPKGQKMQSVGEE